MGTSKASMRLFFTAALEYATAVAAAANATVYFTNGTVHSHLDEDGKVGISLTEAGSSMPTNWQSVTINGSRGVYTNAAGEQTRFSYNAKTGMATQDRPSTGSIIKKSTCVDKSKCGN